MNKGRNEKEENVAKSKPEYARTELIFVVCVCIYVVLLFHILSHLICTNHVNYDVCAENCLDIYDMLVVDNISLINGTHGTRSERE